MDEFKIIFWIIIALVYLFSRARKKAQQQAPSRRPVSAGEEQDVDMGPKKRPLTFEELLREIEQAKPKEAPPPPPPNPYRPPVKVEPEYVDYDEEIKDETEDLEKTDYDYRNQDKIYEVYEEAKKQAFVRPSLEETVKLQDTIVRFSQFKSYEQRERRNLAEDYLREFKDPNGFRKAFIMSEILRRKF